MVDWKAIAAKLGPGFASRSAQHDADASFVAENFEEMRQHRLFSAAVPTELGGGGANLAEICDVLRELACYDGSTSLAFSMHSHLLETLKWRYRHNLTPSSEPPLRRVAAEELVLISSGGSDWLEGSGTLMKEEGGYRFSAKKVFGSGPPATTIRTTDRRCSTSVSI